MPEQTVSQMTRDELTRLVSTVVETKILEIFGDPDEGLQIDSALRERLLSQMSSVASGERGASLDDVADRLGLE